MPNFVWDKSASFEGGKNRLLGILKTDIGGNLNFYCPTEPSV